MLSLTKKLLSSTPYDYFTDTEVATVLGHNSSPARRHSLVKRALAKGEIIRLKRGIYIFSEEYRRSKPDLFELADLLYHPSYISLESAFSYYNAIPEAVYAVTCATTKRKKSFKTILSNFDYFRIPERCFYQGVTRVKTESSSFFIASLEKALLDYLHVYKKSWSSLSDLIKELRFDEGLVKNLNYPELQQIAETYKSKRINKFIRSIKNEY